MATFSYKAKTANGETVAGVLTAESQQAVLRMLDDRALFPITVNEGTATSRRAITGGQRKVNLRQMSTLYSQMADLLRAGVPVLRALETLGRTTSNPLLAEILKEVHSDVSSGETLADAMAKHRNAFNELTIAMVRAGEQGGFLEDVLARVSIFVERQDELRNKLIGSMIYPCILLFAGMTVVTFLMGFVVPKIRGFLDNVEKPWLTIALFSACDFLQANGLYVLGALVIGVMVVVPVLRSEQGKLFLDHFKLPLKKRIRSLSRGQRAQAALALAVAPDPDVFILDDPTLGLDTVVRREFLESLIQIIQRSGRTILFSSHILGDVERIADRIGILVDGVLRVDCSTEQFKESLRKVVLEFSGTPPCLPDIHGLVGAKSGSNRCELVIAGYNETHRAQLEVLAPCRIVEIEMNLEDAFIEYTRSSNNSVHLLFEEHSPGGAK